MKTTRPAVAKPKPEPANYTADLDIEQCDGAAVKFELMGCDALQPGERDSLARVIAKRLASLFTTEEINKEIYE